ncbi:hypothetical protein G6F62_014819 [Rhizopus arrhizus]|nr:hypothetical protein G6F62_014819 [Rhizopus arrhizus]
MPSWRAIASPVRRLSPVIMATFRPRSCSARIAAAVVSLIGSATAIMAASRPLTAAYRGVLPSSPRRAASWPNMATSRPRSRM